MTEKITLLKAVLLIICFASNSFAGEVKDFDIRGVKLGMKVETAQKIFEEKGDIKRWEKRGLAFTSKSGKKLSYKHNFKALDFSGHSSDISLVSSLKDESTIFIKRGMSFFRDDEVQIETIKEQLTDKYGPATFSIESGSSYSKKHFLLWTSSVDKWEKLIQEGENFDGVEGFEKDLTSANFYTNPHLQKEDKGYGVFLMCSITNDSRNLNLAHFFRCYLVDYPEAIESRKSLMLDLQKADENLPEEETKKIEL